MLFDFVNQQEQCVCDKKENRYFRPLSKSFWASQN